MDILLSSNRLLTAHFKFKMFRLNTRFLKYKLSYTTFFRERSILRYRRTSYKIYINIISIWVGLFRNAKCDFNLTQSYFIFDSLILIPPTSFIINNFNKILNISNCIPVRVSYINPINTIYMGKGLNKIKIYPITKLLLNKSVLTLQFPYNIINLSKSHYMAYNPILITRLNNFISSGNKFFSYDMDPIKNKIKKYNFSKKNLTNLLLGLVLFIIRSYRKTLVYSTIAFLS